MSSERIYDIVANDNKTLYMYFSGSLNAEFMMYTGRNMVKGDGYL